MRMARAAKRRLPATRQSPASSRFRGRRAQMYTPVTTHSIVEIVTASTTIPQISQGRLAAWGLKYPCWKCRALTNE